MSKVQGYVFVLWGDRFREAEAAIFVTVLREAGLRVKVVGLTPYQLSGAYGLALVPDLTLGQALLLAAQTIGVIIPSPLSGLKGLQHDPRIVEFFQQAARHQARFVLGAFTQTEIAKLTWLPVPAEQITFYPPFENLVTFAQTLAAQLAPVQDSFS